MSSFTHIFCQKVLSSTSQATTYLQSKRGQRQFDVGSNTGLISLSGIGCGETTGCKCGNNREEVRKTN